MVSDKSHGDFYGYFTLSCFCLIMISILSYLTWWLLEWLIWWALLWMIHPLETKSTTFNWILLRKNWILCLVERKCSEGPHLSHKSNDWVAGVFQPNGYPLLTLPTWMLVIWMVWIIEQWADSINWKAKEIVHPLRPICTEIFIDRVRKGNSFL